MMKIFKSLSARLCVAAFLSAATLYAFVPPPHRAEAQFADQGTWGGTSGGSANAQTFTIANLTANKPGVFLHFVPGFTNSGPTQINVSGIGLVNVVRPSSVGNVAFSGGEFQAGEATCVVYIGSVYQLGCNVDLTPIGRTVEFRGSATPRGTLIEDGTCFSTTGQYAPLFAVIGTTYNALAPVACTGGQFAVPDSRGTAFMALDGQGANGSANRITTATCATPNAIGLCGVQTYTLVLNNLPTFTPSGSVGTTMSPAGGYYNSGTAGSAPTSGSAGGGTTPSISSTFTGNAVNPGGAQAHTILSPHSFGRRAIKY